MATNSSIDNDKKTEGVAEESGWTAYLEDFSCNDNGSFMSSSSLISDAAWNGPDGIRRMNLNKLKKSTNRRKYTYEYDNDLEDTASSPVNSPKVSTMKEVNHRRFNDIASSDFLGQQSSSNNSSKYERNTKKKNTSIIENKTLNQYTELKKRGLCLVPMSALINYIG